MSNGRAGSKLFHSLLDGHPQIICFPRSFQFNSFWKAMSGKQNDLNFLLDSFIDKYYRFFSGKLWYRTNHYDRADRLGPNMNETFSIDIDRFKKYVIDLLKNTEVNRNIFFMSLHFAYQSCCNKSLYKNSIIFYHIHSADHYDEINMCLSDFPGKVYLLVMCRHPVENIKSCFKILKMRNMLYMPELTHYHEQILRGERHLQDLFPQLDIRTLSFEQLHTDNHNIMRSFAHWAGIDWHESLLLSTMHGKLWWGNGEIPRNGANPNWNTYMPNSFLEKKDFKIFLHLIPKRMSKFGYITHGSKKTKSSKIIYLFSLILPTCAEWLSLRCFFSIKYWLFVLKKINEDINDLNLQDFDYYTRQKLSIDKQIFNANSKFKREFIRFKRISEQLTRQIIMLNPLTWIYYVYRRIIYYHSFSRKYGRDKEGMPISLLDNHVCKDR